MNNTETIINIQDFRIKSDNLHPSITPLSAKTLVLKYSKSPVIMVVTKLKNGNHADFYPVSSQELLQRTLAYYNEMESTSAQWISVKQLEKISNE